MIAGVGPTRPAPALRGHDPPDPAPERRPRSSAPRDAPRLSVPPLPSPTILVMDVAGKVALITGGSNGIGEGVARHLAAGGAHVVLADIDDARGKAVADELNGVYVRTDVADPAASVAAVARRRRRLRRPPHRPPERRHHVVVRHGRRLRSRGLSPLHVDQPRRCRLRHRGVSSRHHGQRWWHHRRARHRWPGSWRHPSIPSTAPTSTRSSAWCARSVTSTPLDGIKVHALCPVLRPHQHHQGRGADAGRHGVPDHRRGRRRRRLPAHPRFRHHGPMLVRRGGTRKRAVPISACPGTPARLSFSGSAAKYAGLCAAWACTVMDPAGGGRPEPPHRHG